MAQAVGQDLISLAVRPAGGNFRSVICNQPWNADLVYRRLKVTVHPKVINDYVLGVGKGVFLPALRMTNFDRC